MPNAYSTSEQIVAHRLEDGKQCEIKLTDLRLIGNGRFSNVYRGHARSSCSGHQDVVIKKTWPPSDDPQLEVEVLTELGQFKHQNVVRLLFYLQKPHNESTCLWLIFEDMQMSLHDFLEQQKRQLDGIEVKLITWQLFRGLNHLHSIDCCHRDVKPQNMLYNSVSGVLKISDFGSSAKAVWDDDRSPNAVTRSYRPPELLLGATRYGNKIDTWSAGCVFGELLKGSTLLEGKSAVNQVSLIFDQLGEPSEEDIKAMRVTSEHVSQIIHQFSYEEPGSEKKSGFQYIVEQLEKDDKGNQIINRKIGIKDMVESLKLMRLVLVFQPRKRLGGVGFLTHDYFLPLFCDDTRRFNGRRVRAVNSMDWLAVKTGDKPSSSINDGAI